MNYTAIISSTKGLIDILAILIAGYIAYLFRFGFIEISNNYQVLILLGALLFTFIGSTVNLYGSWRGQNIWKFNARTATVFLVSFSILFVLLVFSKTSTIFSRIWMGYWVIITLTTLISIRLAAHTLLGRLREKGVNKKKILILGISPTALNIISTLQKKDWIGFEVAGVVPLTSQCKKEPWLQTINIPIIEKKDQLPEYISENKISEVWICLPLTKGDLIQDLLYQLRHSTVNIRYAPDMSDFQLLNHKVTELAGFYTLDLSCSSMHGTNLTVKRIEDTILGLIIFIAIIPTLLLISLGVKLSSPGPVLFKQRRYGMDGKPFNVYKFRSMVVHQQGENLVQASKTDDRITTFGAFIRRTSLDELPQFFNVLQGKMSIVGPRPHAIVHNEQYKDQVQSYMKRHKVKPGITGWAQVNGYRGETDTVDKMNKRVEHDLYYIEHWSLWLDLKIIYMTLSKGFINKNAY